MYEENLERRCLHNYIMRLEIDNRKGYTIVRSIDWFIHCQQPNYNIIVANGSLKVPHVEKNFLSK